MTEMIATITIENFMVDQVAGEGTKLLLHILILPVVLFTEVTEDRLENAPMVLEALAMYLAMAEKIFEVRTLVEKENENAIDTHPESKPGQIEDTETENGNATIIMTDGKQITLPGIDLIDSDQIEIVRIDRIGAMTADLKDTMIAVAMMSTVAMTEAIELKVLTDQPLAILAILATLDTLAMIGEEQVVDQLLGRRCTLETCPPTSAKMYFSKFLRLMGLWKTSI